MGEEYKYNVEDILDGNSVGGEDTFFTYVVDPNPANNVSVAAEDLFIFCRLRAFSRNRSVITSDNTFSSNSQDEDGIYFITSTKQNSKGYATTDYTNIGGINGSIEGFGIKNISIEMAMMTPPTVEITFVDVRGAAVFNNYEDYDAEGIRYNKSKFNSFFRLPAPIYELTVKGYYGKAVTYYLNLAKFEASVDTSSGDFIIKCKFLGYQFSFLTDIMTNYVISLNSSSEGQKLLRDYIKKDGNRGLLTIPNLLQKYTEISKYVEDFKKEDAEYQVLKVFNSIEEKFLELQRVVGQSVLINDIAEYGANINYGSFTNSSGYLFLRDIGLFGQESFAMELANLQNFVNQKATEINELINVYKNQFNSLGDLKLELGFLKQSKSYNEVNQLLLDEIKNLIVTKEGKNIDNFNLTFISNKLNNVLPVFFIDFYDLRGTVQQLIKKVSQLKKKSEEQVIENLNKSFTDVIEFNPTVFNVFEILFGNVDIFLELVYNVCVKADGLGEIRVGDMKNYFANNGNSAGFSDIPETDNRIYPFPAVYGLDGEYVWLGDVVGEENPNFPEIELVNKIISGAVSDTNYKNTENVVVQTFSETQLYKWLPVSPIDVVGNNLQLSNNFDYGDENLNVFYGTLFNRLAILFNHTRVSDRKLLKYAELEAAIFVENISNETIKKFLLNLSRDVFVEKGLNYFNSNTISESLLDYNLLEQSGIFYLDSDISFKEDRHFFSNLNLSPSIQNLLNKKNISIDNIIYDSVPNNYRFDKAFILNNDLTLCFKDKWTETNIQNQYKSLYGVDRKQEIPYSSVIVDLKFLDGEKSGVFLNGKDSKNFYINNNHKYIGISFTNYNNRLPLFDQFYYTDNNNLAKSFLFLQSINFKDETFLINNIQNTASFHYVNNLYCAYVGGLFYRTLVFKNTGVDILTSDIITNPSFLNIAAETIFNTNSIVNFGNYSEDFISFFINIFLDFSNNTYKPTELDGLENNVRSYVTLGKQQYIEESEKNEYKNAWDSVFSKINEVSILVILSPKKIFVEDFQTQNYPNLINPTNYLTVFFNSMISKLNESGSQNSPSNTRTINGTENPNSNVKDKNIKIRIYNDIKAIYDKWLSYSTIDGKIYNFASYLKGESTTKKLIDHCYFIDRTWSDIGNVAVLNPKPIMTYVNQTDNNIYSFMSLIMKDNNFNIFNIPSFVNYYNKEDVSNMFKPYTFIENSEGGACLVFQYVAGNSKILDLNARVGYVNDGFDLSRNNYLNIPKSLKERKIPSYTLNNNSQLNTTDLKDYLAKYNLCVFRVGYADQNQNIFKEIVVTQEDHRETQESILVQNEIAGGKGGTKRLYMGMDLYNAYSLRSYKTTVTSMGNLQIMPTQYFQLDNIPLFHGAHIITAVRHEIEPHNITTIFSGRRISKFSYPVVDKMTAYLNLEINEKLNAPLLLTNPLITGALINGTDYDVTSTEDLVNLGYSNELIKIVTDNVNSPSNLTENLLFAVQKNNTNASFILDGNINTAILNQRLTEIFKSNPANVPTYGIGAYLCASWVRRVLLNLGVAKVGNASTDAWDWFMGLPENQNWLYFTSSNKQGDWSFEDLKNVGVKNGSLLFGYYNGSNYKTLAYNKMKEFTNNRQRIQLLTENKRIVENFDFTPVTHVGIFYNDMFYELVNGKITLSPNRSFIPVASYHFLTDLQQLAN